MKKNLSFLILLACDIIVIFLSIIIAVALKNLLGNNPIFTDIERYASFIQIYAIILFLFIYQGIYFRHYDFWRESNIIIKSCFLGLLITLVFIKNNYNYLIIFLIFIFIAIFLPISKFILKKALFRLGLWKKQVKIIGEMSEFESQIFSDPHLGYICANNCGYESIFITAQAVQNNDLNELMEQNVKKNKEILFIPEPNSYDLSRAHVYNVFDYRTNIVALQNALQSKFNLALKRAIDVFVILLAAPILLPVLLSIVIIMKLKEPKAKVFFSQSRLGLGGTCFNCYKFRSMCVNQDFMPLWLEKNPDEVAHYSKYKKYKNDPRITKIGRFLRKTSLDELPQLLNVLKGEMSLVGPRPYLPSEADDFKKHIELILSVKPGITGIWQVSGRSDVDFATRAQMDAWYMKNWSIWNDIIIIVKTIKVVLLRSGAS